MKKVLLLKFGELFLKGKNRHEFLKMLMKNISKKLAGYQFRLDETQGRLILSQYEEELEDDIIEKVQKVFGLIAVMPALEFDATLENIEQRVLDLDFGDSKTFKVESKRADKRFAMTSMGLKDRKSTRLNSSHP